MTPDDEDRSSLAGHCAAGVTDNRQIDQNCENCENVSLIHFDCNLYQHFSELPTHLSHE